MTPKQQKEFDAATAELSEVRSNMVSAQSDIDAASKTVEAARKTLQTADEKLNKAKQVLADLKPYEQLAIKKTSKLLNEAIPGIVNPNITHENLVRVDHIEMHFRDLSRRGCFPSGGWVR